MTSPPIRMFSLFPVVVLAFLAVLTTTTVVSASFAPIVVGLDESEQLQVRGIHLPPFCPTNAMDGSSSAVSDVPVPNVPVTILPSASDQIVVLTSPANLVTARLGTGLNDRDLLEFEWNYDVLLAQQGSLGETGIIVQIPDLQFQVLNSCCNTQTEILEGFTNLQEFQLTTGSATDAILAFVSVTPSIEISEGAQATLERELGFDTVVAASNAALNLKGDIVGSLKATSSAAITLQGSISSAAATSSSLADSASLVTNTGSDCSTVQVSGDATCTVETGLQVSATLGTGLSQSDDGTRTSCIAREIVTTPSTMPDDNNSGSSTTDGDAGDSSSPGSAPTTTESGSESGSESAAAASSSPSGAMWMLVVLTMATTLGSFLLLLA